VGIHLTNRSLLSHGLKFCQRCSSEKPITDFPQWRGKSNGSVCVDCKRVVYRKLERRRRLRSSKPRQQPISNSKELKSFYKHLNYCVVSVFKRLLKVCPRCHEEKLLVGFGLSRRGNRHGLRKYCKACMALKTSERRKANPEKTKEQRRAHRQRRSLDPAWRKARTRKRYVRLMARVAAGDPKAIARRRAQQESGSKRAVIRRLLFPELYREFVSRAKVFERDGGKCRYCQKALRNVKNGWHLDHYIPLARGGEHSHANVCVSCPECNVQKSDMMPEHFIPIVKERGIPAASLSVS
jgi:hypothetical protein